MTDSAPAGTGQPASASQPAAPRRTPLTAVHEQLGASLTDFAGWLMPLRYSSETAEHNAVRTAAGLFDLSHMGEFSVTGTGAAAALDYALTGEPSALKPGRARYTMICAEDGGVIDDLIVYRLADAEFLIVANAANTGPVGAALAERAAGFDATATDRTDDYALIAVQGPRSAAILAPLTSIDLADVKYYASYPAQVAGRGVLLARTGYTGEDGFEIFAAPQDAEYLWAEFSKAGGGGGLIPAGLAARDTLRLEAGMPLYGNELGAEMTPFDAGLGRVVKLDKPGGFVGRDALARRAQEAPVRQLVGLTVQSRRIPRHGYPVLFGGEPAGVVTSGAPSPTLGRPIAMAYVRPEVAATTTDPSRAGTAELAVDVRGNAEPATLVELPFYRRRS
ncbi:MAG TPA: glycine cleavage system aminomethyltransferase GcvT [Streptosporangiaceae bacterium]|nr:glycine cleavage system aminomethyltransferase GcvT [Streptosporangiaceae bacterium]